MGTPPTPWGVGCPHSAPPDGRPSCPTPYPLPCSPLPLAGTHCKAVGEAGGEGRRCCCLPEGPAEGMFAPPNMPETGPRPFSSRGSGIPLWAPHPQQTPWVGHPKGPELAEGLPDSLAVALAVAVRRGRMGMRVSKKLEGAPIRPRACPPQPFARAKPKAHATVAWALSFESSATSRTAALPRGVSPRARMATAR